MASKKELQAQLDKAQTRLAESEQREAEKASEIGRLLVEHNVLRVDNRAYKRRESERRVREYNAEQARLREAEHKARRERLDQLGAGLLPIEGATSYAFIHERDGESGLEVFVPLDAEERRIVEGFLDARNQVAEPAPAASESLLDRINNMARVNLQSYVVPHTFLAGHI